MPWEAPAPGKPARRRTASDIVSSAEISFALLDAAAFDDPPALRHVMFEVDELNRTIEPLLRAPDQTPVVASAARSMLRWAADPAWTAYHDEPEFLGDAPLFEAYRGWLLAGSQQLAEAATAVVTASTYQEAVVLCPTSLVLCSHWPTH